jgi:Raf kinase inhibitor-like YbhB/YbcL family protein
MILSSPNFKNREKIPVKFTGDGLNINPCLEINEVPIKTKSFTLIFVDPDAPMGEWIHWIIWNIDPATRKIAENNVPKKSIQGENSWGEKRYGGPTPPSGTHRYYFRLYALDTRLNIPENSNKEKLIESMKNNILEKAELIGFYR